MASYGVQTTNLFDLLDEEGSQAPKGAKAAKPAEPKVGAKKAAAQMAAAEEASASKGPARGGRKDFPEAAQFPPREGRSERSERGRGGARGGRGGRGGAARPGKREFDRRGAPTKKAGGVPTKGGHRLGHQVEAGTEDAPAEEATTAAEPAPAEEPVEEAAPVVVEEEDDGNVTFDQFLERQKANLIVEERELRAVEVDDKKWRAGKVINPGQSEAAAKAEAEKKAGGEKKAAKKQIISLDEFVGDAPRAAPRREEHAAGQDRPFRGGRGGRGGAPFRGGRGAAGAPRGGRGGFNVVNTNDESAFPKLGK